MSVSETTARCLLCRTERHTGLLCARHAHLLRTWLDDIVETYALLDDVIEPGTVISDITIKHTKNAEAPPPARLDVIALRDARNPMVIHPGDIPSTLGVLGSWAQRVRDDKHLSTPTACTTVSSETSILVTHLDWIFTQTFVDDLLAELKPLRRALLDAVGEYAPKPIGRCPMFITETITTLDESSKPTTIEIEHQCRGPLYPDRWGGMSVTCRACGETWGQDFIERETRRLEELG